ncbi:polysaccharide biosynthesis tyrosine autokinase, partial [Oscillatoriales cyanobacterium LEGE 11467]
GAAFLREAIDDGVHSTDQLQQQVALPLLGIVPELPQTRLGGFTRHLPFRPPQKPESWLLQALDWQPFRESLDLIYQGIHQNMHLLDAASKCKSLLVTSALAGEGKSTLVLSLALSAARLHQKVLLIDGDLRRPVLHERLGLSNSQGLSTVLSGEIASPNLQSISASGETLDVLTAGLVPADPVKLLSSQRMTELMTEFERNYDLILLDAPPVLGTVDVLQTALRCRGVVMVTRLDRITQSELTQAIAMLRQLRLLGIVANGSKSAPVSYLHPANANGSISVSTRRSREQQGYDRN